MNTVQKDLCDRNNKKYIIYNYKTVYIHTDIYVDIQIHIHTHLVIRFSVNKNLMHVHTRKYMHSIIYIYIYIYMITKGCELSNGKICYGNTRYTLLYSK